MFFSLAKVTENAYKSMSWVTFIGDVRYGLYIFLITQVLQAKVETLNSNQQLQSKTCDRQQNNIDQLVTQTENQTIKIDQIQNDIKVNQAQTQQKLQEVLQAVVDSVSSIITSTDNVSVTPGNVYLQ